MSAGLAVVERGDLSNEFVTNRKDEFYSLTKSLNSMLISLRGLICDMKSFGNKVNGMSTEVYNQTEVVNLSMNDISEAMREVALGIQNQAQETETSTGKMLSLSNNINAVTDKANIMVQTADSTIAAIEQGKTIGSAINKKSAHTVEITKILVENIRDVEKQSFEIIVGEKDSVQDSIQNIAAVSQEVSAATQEVSATVEEQADVMNNLAREVENLKSDVLDLNASINNFKI